MKYSLVPAEGTIKGGQTRTRSASRGQEDSSTALIGGETGAGRRSSRAVNNGYLWKADEHLNRVAKMRYSHGDELTDLPGVTGIGIGKDHIILYVSGDEVEVPDMVEYVRIIKVRRR
jgi:hypothetical protein